MTLNRCVGKESGATIGSQLIAPARMSQSVQRFLLDLSDSFARQTESGSDLIQRHRIFAIKAKIETQYFGFPANQRAKG